MYDTRYRSWRALRFPDLSKELFNLLMICPTIGPCLSADLKRNIGCFWHTCLPISLLYAANRTILRDMKLGHTFLLTALACVSNIGHHAYAANSFAGSNLYYAAGLSDSDRTTLLQGLQDAGMKVLRVWLDGQSSKTTKGTQIASFPSLEPDEIGTYDDTVLNKLDAFMVDAQAHKIKLLISMHSFNSLQANDAYGSTYGTGSFYTSDNATTQFDNRLRHVMNHNHSTLNKPWKELSDYIFAFEAQNEAMIGQGPQFISDHQSWQCDRATTIKTELGNNTGILVTTGGASYLDESVQPGWLSCPALDVVAIHGYGTGDFDTSKIQSKVSQAQAAGKKLIFQEWGACYFTTSNNNCPSGSVLNSATRNSNIQTWAKQITAAGVPWMYWQIIPNADPHGATDYEIAVNTDPRQSQASSAFDFSANLLS
ncbi:beta-1,3-mannanase [Phellopilus nigrolimitatus]|nr:beta-1,3-mannanase [Phellopilus nigrolimitatus]